MYVNGAQVKRIAQVGAGKDLHKFAHATSSAASKRWVGPARWCRYGYAPATASSACAPRFLSPSPSPSPWRRPNPNPAAKPFLRVNSSPPALLLLPHTRTPHFLTVCCSVPSVYRRPAAQEVQDNGHRRGASSGLGYEGRVRQAHRLPQRARKYYAPTRFRWLAAT
jgi:hypothetical protein